MAKGNIRVQNVSKHQLRKLLELPWVADEALSTYKPAHVLPDGRVLLYMPGDVGGTVYPSREALEEMNRQLAKMDRQIAEQSAAGNPSPMLTLLPPIDDFLRDVEAHATSLGARIRVAGEALDRSVESLDAVDKALKRIPWAKREVPDLVTPLVAYVGEVLRRRSGGRWVKSSHQKRVAVCDPDERLAQLVAKRKLQPIAVAAAEKAADEARARGDSKYDVDVAYSRALQAVMDQLPGLKSYRVEVREENEPVIQASNGRGFQPFAIVFVPMVEPSKRLPLRNAVGTHLHVAGYPPVPKPDTGQSAGSQGKP